VNCVDTNSVANGAITSTKIATAAVGASQINNTQVQSRVAGSCAAGSSIRTVNADGTVVCETDDGTTYQAGIGITLLGGTIISIKDEGVGTLQIDNNSILGEDINKNAALNVASLTASGFANAPSLCISGDCRTTWSTASTRRIVVAESGGDYTTVSAALSAITPSATAPYVIDIMPGTYVENITMKDYIHLRGAGREITTIKAATTTAATITVSDYKDHTAISGLTITGGKYGVYIYLASPTISGNRITGHTATIYDEGSLSMITGNEISGGTYGIHGNGSWAMVSGNMITRGLTAGIYNEGGSPMISGNTISKNDGTGILNGGTSAGRQIMITGNLIENNQGNGITNDHNAAPAISGNTITRNGRHGIENDNSSPVISGNTIMGNVFCGIYNYYDYTSPTILYNRITDNNIAKLSGYADIYVADQFFEMTPKISFNVYDTITGTKGVGMYNINSDGTPAPLP
jgi:hypothetical protein